MMYSALKRPRLLSACALVTALAACGGDSPTEPTSARVGPDGGTFILGDVSLAFPPGAVSDEITVTVHIAETFQQSPLAVAGSVYELGPDGIQFAKPVELMIAYDPDSLPVGVRGSELRLYTSSADAWEEVTGSFPAPGKLKVSGEIESFSVYGVLGVPAVSVTIDDDRVWLGLAAFAQMQANVRDRDGTRMPSRVVTWSSSAPDIASVDDQGRVAGVAMGDATITATAEGKIGTASVTVSELSWQAEALATPGLRDVWGTSPTDVYAVGDGGAIVHYDGVDWTEMDSGKEAALRDVWGTSSFDVYAVGDGVVLRFDGAIWDDEPLAPGRDLFGVWGAPGGEVFAVGRPLVVIRRSDGRWEEDTHDLSAEDGTFQEVWGTSATDVYAAGWLEDAGARRGVVLHWDGFDWSVAYLAGEELEIEGLWGSPAGGSVFAGGRYLDGTHRRVVLRGPVSWSDSDLGNSSMIHGISGTSRDDVYAVGARSLQYLNGIEWKAHTIPLIGADNYYRGIWRQGTEVFLVGETMEGGGRGLAARGGR
jgi:hypothetical protein